MPSPRTPLRSLVPSVLCLLLAGCTDERFEAELVSAAFTAPVRLASAPAVVDAGARPGAATAAGIGEERRVLSLGAPDGDERYLFGEIADVAASASGDTVFVLDRMQRQVKAFSREGTFLFRFGGQGKGPGEYQDPASIVLLPWNGQLAIWDVQLQRLTFATPGGETVRTAIPIRQNDFGRVGKKLRAWREGLVLELRDDPLRVDAGKQRGWLARLDTLGQVRDTVLGFVVPPIRGSGITEKGEVVQTQFLNPPTWTPEPAWELHPDGEVVFAPGGRPEVFRFAADGTPRDHVVRPWEPETLTRRERVIQIAFAQEKFSWARELPAWFLEIFHRVRFARIRPSVTGIAALPGGGFAVRRFDADDDPEGRSRTWDEHRPDGSAAGALRFPAGFDPRLAVRDRVYGLRRDTLNVDYLEAYRR